MILIQFLELILINQNISLINLEIKLKVYIFLMKKLFLFFLHNNFNEHLCKCEEIYIYLIENFIKSQSLYIIYLESWSYEHFSIMFRCFDWSKLFSGWTMDRVSASRTEWQSLSNTKSTWSEWDEWVTYFSLNENWLELTWFARFYLIFSPLESILLLSYFSKKLEIKFFLLIKQSLKLSLLS